MIGMSNNIILLLENVTKIYPSGDKPIYALNSISLQIKKGEFVIVMGPSGSGKTTLLNVIAGLTKTTEGQTILNNKTLQKLSDNQKAEVRRNDIGFIFQFFNLHDGLSAQENIELPMMIARKFSTINRRQRSEKLIQLVDLNHRINSLPHELSGGEKQRVGIARALANDPQLVLADEPTGDLDSKMAQEIIEILIKLNKERNKTFIIVSHDYALLRKGMRLLRMEDGRIIDDNIVTEKLISNFYEETNNYLLKSLTQTSFPENQS
ncbi:MAG: putative ABC transporter ATP-binding protein [Candidatus Heimdallarchaeota archaeon LC_3]|nr:MAG: putative ABC transporter ATP-binding protein [Candidatus Heimdallarchaeota archaeon LC_3]